MEEIYLIVQKKGEMMTAEDVKRKDREDIGGDVNDTQKPFDEIPHQRLQRKLSSLVYHAGQG